MINKVRFIFLLSSKRKQFVVKIILKCLFLFFSLVPQEDFQSLIGLDLLGIYFGIDLQLLDAIEFVEGDEMFI